MAKVMKVVKFATDITERVRAVNRTRGSVWLGSPTTISSIGSTKSSDRPSKPYGWISIGRSRRCNITILKIAGNTTAIQSGTQEIFACLR